MASAVASASPTIFESLPARPPTPPREAQHDIDASAKADSRRSTAFEPSQSLQTPPNAHATHINGSARSNPGSSRLRKKVEWSAHTEYKEAAEYKDARSGKLSPTAPSSAQSKPVKGILKISSSPLPQTNPLGGPVNGHATQTNIIEMLDSTIKQLAGADRPSRLDAYMTLARALKASNNLPDRVALQDKMSLFMQFIQRDVMAKGENSTLDSSLINHALNLLATFLQFPAIASTLTSDFGIFILDHAIRCFEDATIPKDVVRHLMQAVAFQNFNAKVMTTERVGRLVLALHRIENHLTGKGIIMCRIHIYKRLVKQCRAHMIVHTDWIKDLFTDLLSNVKEIRTQALSLGSEAGFSLRSDKQLMLKATEIFQTTHENETYIEFYIKKLQELIKDRSTSSSVPQIWSVVILFLRCPLDRWQHYGPWLTLVQSAFNMADSATKQEANLAWNRYVYLSLLDAKIGPKALGTLCQPLLSQLKRKMSPKQPVEAIKLRNVVIGGICNLFYYAFAPGNEKYPASMVWDVAVQPIVNLLISLDGKPDMPTDCLEQAEKLIEGLLDVSTPKVWRHDRILDTALPTTDELPAIDSKWTRRHADKILLFITPIIEKNILSLADKTSGAFRLWQALAGSVAAASAKDIKMSDETSKFLAAALGLLSKIWSQGVPDDAPPESSTLFLDSIKNFVAVLVQKLGVLPFTEKRFSATLANNTFEPLATPSQPSDGTDKANGVVRVPLHHLFLLFSTLPKGIADNDAFSDFFQTVVQPFFKDRSAKARTDLSKELVALLPRNALCPWGPWMVAAQNMCLPQEKMIGTPASSITDTGYHLGPSYRDIVTLLERGLSEHPNLPLKHWCGLFNVLAAHAEQQVGHAGQALALVEPLSKFCLDHYLAITPVATQMEAPLKVLTSLLLVAKPARDSQAIETARQRLWGTPISISRSSTTDVFDHLYKLSNKALGIVYDNLSELAAIPETADLLKAHATFLDSSFAITQLRSLMNVQQGVCTIIKDSDDRWLTEFEPETKTAIHQLWDEICKELKSSTGLSKDDIIRLEPLFTAAFQSKHDYVVNKVAEAWNQLAKDEETFDCSDSLKSVVSSLQSKLDLALPSTSQAEFGAQADAGQGNTSFVALSSASTHQDASGSAAKASKSKAPSRSSSRRRTATAKNESSPKATSTPKRLRHENSQLRFAHIASSSPVDDESQHLTERQREVRSRQRGTAALYSEMVNSSPSKTQGDEMDIDTPRSTRNAPKSTPKRGSAFSNAITSTPTPRRGQFLMNLDDDPPSSPPLPRPDPLQSEIEQRSRGNSVIEQWQFSSPPGTPVVGEAPTTRTAKSQKARKQKPEPASQSSQSQIEESSQGRRQTRSRRHTIGANVEEEVIPSSLEIAEEVKITVDSPANLTRSQRRQRQAASSPIKSNNESAAAPPVVPREGSDLRRKRAKSTSQVDDDNELPQLMVETPEPRGRRASRRRQTLDASAMEVTETEAQAPADVSVAQPQPIIPAALAEEPAIAASPAGKRKRKRVSRQASRSRKRRSVGEGLVSQTEPDGEDDGDEDEDSSQPLATVIEAAEGATEPVAQPASEAAPEPSLAVPDVNDGNKENNAPGSAKQSTRDSLSPEKKTSKRMRTRSRGRKSLEPRETGNQQVKEKDEADTDEEIFSQLTNESQAASQVPEPAGPTDVVMEDMKAPQELTPRAAPAIRQPPEDKPVSILSALEQGLAQLRGATLSRDEVYKMEDMLMDMKRELYAAEQRGRGTDSLPPAGN